MNRILRKIYFRIIGARKIIFAVIVIFLVFYVAYRNVDKVEFYNKYHAPIQFVKKLSNILYLPTKIFPSKLDRYDLYITGKNLDFLNENLPDLYASKILTDEYKKSVPATFVFDDKEYEVKVRYRGDTDNHWRDPKKSWLINFKKENYFENKEEIHLIIPEDRDYLVEELDFYRAKKSGLAVPETKFVNLFVNGERQGVYWLLEGWGKDFLERQYIPGDVNLYGGIDFIDRISANEAATDSLHSWKKYSNDVMSDVDNYADLDKLLEVINNSSDDYFNKNIGKIVDMDNFYKWEINQYLVGSTHQSDSNLRFYFDSTKGKFVFIPWDVSIGELLPPYLEKKYNILVTRILKNPVFLQERNKRLWAYVSDDKNLQDDLNFYDNTDKLTKTDLYKDFKKVESNLAYRQKISDFRKKISERFYAAKSNLEYANAVLTASAKKDSSYVTLDVGSKSFSSIEVKKITIQAENCNNRLALFEDANGNKVYDYADRLVGNFSCKDSQYSSDPSSIIYAVKEDLDDVFLKPGYSNKIFFVTLGNLPPESLLHEDKLTVSLINAITDQPLKDVSVRYVFDNLNLDLDSKDLSLAEFIKINPIFSLSKNDLILKTGNYLIDKDIIISQNTKLIIEPGTAINLAAGSSILSYSPIIANGTPDRPIVFRPASGQPWGAVGIVGVSATSTLENVFMNDGKDDYIDGTFISGMLSVYHSPVVIKNSRFSNAKGDDSVNIKYAFGKVLNSEFINNSADGLDLDVNDSLVEKNVFIGNGNDGVDISSSQPVIKGNRIENSGDKCISVGENSSAIIFNNLLKGCNLGIGTKDYSRPLIVNNTIISNKIGIAGYQKKAIFGGSVPNIINSVIWNNDKAFELDEFSELKISNSIITGGYAGNLNSGDDPLLNQGFMVDKSNKVNQNLNSTIYGQLGSGFEPLETIGYSK